VFGGGAVRALVKRVRRWDWFERTSEWIVGGCWRVVEDMVQ